MTEKPKRGFAAMSRERLAEVSSKGGSAVPAKRRSFAANPELAAKAGKKGGRISRGGGRKKKPQ